MGNFLSKISILLVGIIIWESVTIRQLQDKNSLYENYFQVLEREKKEQELQDEKKKSLLPPQAYEKDSERKIEIIDNNEDDEEVRKCFFAAQKISQGQKQKDSSKRSNEARNYAKKETQNVSDDYDDLFKDTRLGSLAS
jgi:hypothetical protein